ncbi:hypothetical protein JTE90_020419 [Oedothorax gibbosus]|uniref:Prismalin-14 n=1 Tax=Oedothorax gibbosus TaxID=931172 RepID=A0AAV6UET0_9ARAC|nr:hypothetical protein JTE90_020419 [Oedothorax gibbosus]
MNWLTVASLLSIAIIASCGKPEKDKRKGKILDDEYGYGYGYGYQPVVYPTSKPIISSAYTPVITSKPIIAEKPYNWYGNGNGYDYSSAYGYGYKPHGHKPYYADKPDLGGYYTNKPYYGNYGSYSTYKPVYGYLGSYVYNPHFHGSYKHGIGFAPAYDYIDW